MAKSKKIQDADNHIFILTDKIKQLTEEINQKKDEKEQMKGVLKKWVEYRKSLIEE